MEEFLVGTVFTAVIFISTAQAQTPDLPALYEISGLSAGEVLNIRAEPEIGTDVIGTLNADAHLQEVVALSTDGNWAQINTGEQSGWASTRFLTDAGGPRWWARDLPLTCFGTEPFWSSVIFRNDPGSLTLKDQSQSSATGQSFSLGRFQQVWGNPQWNQPMNAVMTFDDGGAQAVAVVRAESCNDGMSDREYGLSVNLFVDDGSGKTSSAAYYGGCCSIAN